uniref:Uncharacterized protein n=1 Tax=Setaria italica TaxID=4555 RepID=K3ZBP1_SETIT
MAAAAGGDDGVCYKLELHVVMVTAAKIDSTRTVYCPLCSSFVGAEIYRTRLPVVRFGL